MSYRTIGENTDVFDQDLLDDFKICDKNSRFQPHVVPGRKLFD